MKHLIIYGLVGIAVGFFLRSTFATWPLFKSAYTAGTSA
jgi:cyanate permease